MNKQRIFIIYLFITTCLFMQCTKQKSFDAMLDDFFAKEEVTILVTDSGLGGLSVAADIAQRLPESGVFRSVRIVFFNALFHNKSGYNSLDSEKRKAQIFDRALNAMNKKYHPDLLLIACNTLSIVYENTRFIRKPKFPVVGIVKTGVDAIARRFDAHPDETAILFATKTTIGSEAHKKQLVDRGYLSEQIIGQPCHKLAGSIERGYDSEETTGLLDQYVTEALDQISGKENPIFISFNCTHFGYIADLFREAFAARGYPDIAVIDPNPMMADFMFQPQVVNRYPETTVTVEIISKTEISEERGQSLVSLLQPLSPETANALVNYTFDPKLFKSGYTHKPSNKN